MRDNRRQQKIQETPNQTNHEKTLSLKNATLPQVLENEVNGKIRRWIIVLQSDN